ncbi:MAG: TonB-dependent receptor [Bacteroidia bacterium]|nr:TonB-dependent receptor [Bacteroidia bacterium]
MNFNRQVISNLKKSITVFALLAHSLSIFSTETDTLRNINLDDVIVSGIKHEQRYWKSSVAATTISSKAMTGLQISEMKDFTAIIPNFFMIDRDSKLTSSVFVRGVGTLISTPGVAMYVDGVPHFEKSSFDINLTEIERVEFLRGPQGTLYGRNAMGGIIHVYTKSPLRHQGTKLRIRGGKYGDAYVMFSHLGRISDKLGYSVAADVSNYDGYIQNVTLNRKADYAQTASVNAKMEWIAAPQLSFRLVNGFDYTSQGAFGYGKYDYRKNENTSIHERIAPVAQDHAGSYHRKLYDGGLQTDYYNQWFWLRSQTSVQLLHDTYNTDQDLSPEFKYIVRTGDKQRLFSQEINLRSLYSERYRWHLGVFTFRQSINRNTDITTPRAVNHKHHRITNSGFAVYHQSDINLTRKLTLEAGIRYDWERMNLDYDEHSTSPQGAPTGNPFTVEISPTFSIWSPKVALNWQLSDHYQLYASVSRGYKTGGFNQIIKKDQDESNRFLPESSWNYEIGGKFLTLGQKLQAEWALFYIDIQNQQVRQAIPGTGSQITNAARSRNIGGEFSFRSQLSRNFSLSGSYGYTHAKFVQYVRDAAKDIRFDGKFTPFVPRHTFSANAEYILRPTHTQLFEHITFALNYNGIADLYWNEDNLLRQPFYGLLGANIGIKRGLVTLNIWGNNLLNEKYTSYLFRVEPSYYARPGRPMTMGATVTIEI